jgi:hypothetical protein
MTTPHLMTLAAYNITNAAELDSDGKLLSTQIPTKLLTYRVNHYSAGVPANSAIMLVHCPSTTISFPINLAGSKIVATVGATAETVLTIKKGSDTVATATFAAAGTTATIVAAAAFSLTSTDVLSVTNQADNDATLANVSFALVASIA